jgi:uridine kinase
MSRPFLIAIAGPSCSGKTTTARLVAEVLPSTIFSLDAYYYDLAGLSFEERARFNFDHPDSLDSGMIAQHLQSLSEGKTVDRPVYDFPTHTRTTMTEAMTASEYLIVEGLFPLYWQAVRDLCDLKVFMDVPHRVCLPRRQARDIAERGRTIESVNEQYSATVQPMADAYVVPTKQYADLVLNGTQPPKRSAEQLLAHLRGIKKS